MAYNIRYSDYITAAGPPDPAEWIGPPGPIGPVGPPGAPGEVSKAYVDQQDAALQQAISLVAQNLVFVGQCHVPTDSTLFTAASGILPSPGALPPAASMPKGYYVIVVQAGSPPGGSNIPPGSYALHDWLVCDGTVWVWLSLGAPSYVASDIAIAPPIGLLGANVQTGLQWLNDNPGVVSFNTRVGAITLTSADVTATTVLAPYALTSAVPAAASTNPVMDGVAAIGALTTFARADHVHASDVSRYAASNPSGYQTAANVTSALVAGSPGAFSTLSASGTVSGAGFTAFVQAALRYLNYVDNSGFSINQRTYVSGTALATGAFGHDRWKAGASGATYLFGAPAGPANTITITAGSLQQVIEGASLAGGNYRLSWTGTAQGRVGAGAYAASPVAVAGIVAGANTTIEFNAGTLGQVKFEAGTGATTWVARPVADEMAACQRFYQTGALLMQASGQLSASTFQCSVMLAVRMRAAPVLAVQNNTSSNLGSFSLGSFGPGNALVYGGGVTTAAGPTGIITEFTASADL